MNIVIPYNASFESVGLMAAFESLDEVSALGWVESQKPVFDVFDETRPDIVVLTRKHLKPTVEKLIKQYNSKVIMIDGFDCEYEKIDLTKLESATNIVQYRNGEKEDRYISDCLYLSMDEWDTLGNEHVPECLSCLIYPNSKLKLKIFGKYKFPFAEYLGNISQKGINNALSSTKIVLVFNKKILPTLAYNKCFCLVHESIGNTEYPSFSKDNIRSSINDWLHNSKTKKAIINTQYEASLKNTYLDIAKDIFIKLGYEDKAELCIKKKQELVS